MSTKNYVSDPGSDWNVHNSFESTFTWDYEGEDDRLLKLYKRGKQSQWDGSTRIDWSIDVDPENPELVPDIYVPIFDSPWWNKMNLKEQAQTRHHLMSWLNSQFLHGEQGALITVGKLIQSLPDAQAKFYAATQAMDEARHLEVYARYLETKIEMIYPVDKNLKTLLEQTVRDSRWDVNFLGMQILVEGLALGAFGLMRKLFTEPLMGAITTYVMADEARHVAFGTIALEGFYPELTEKEREEREELVAEACHLMHQRFLAHDVWEQLNLPTKEVVSWVDSSLVMLEFRRMLFARIVPSIKRIGLWGPKVVNAFQSLDLLQFQDLNPDDSIAADQEMATRMDSYRDDGMTLPEAVERVRFDDIEQTIAHGEAAGLQ